MAELYHTEDEPQLICWDRANYTTFEDQLEAIKNSKTLYIGNLSFFTKESQIIETFSFAGPVKRVIMGLNNLLKTPCGFCFVEFYHQEHCHNALKYLTETVCDDRLIRCDADGGFLPGRQFGRGRSGGQIRDERRTDYDPARGRFVPPSILGMSSGRKRNSRTRDEDDIGGGGGDDREDEERGGGGGKRMRRDYNNGGDHHFHQRGGYHQQGGYNNNNYNRRGGGYRNNNYHNQGNYDDNRHYSRDEENNYNNRSGENNAMETNINSSLETPRD